jgi:hypothetical protein
VPTSGKSPPPLEPTLPIQSTICLTSLLNGSTFFTYLLKPE